MLTSSSMKLLEYGYQLSKYLSLKVTFGIWFGTNLPSYLHLYYMKSKSKNQPKSKNNF